MRKIIILAVLLLVMTCGMGYASGPSGGFRLKPISGIQTAFNTANAVGNSIYAINLVCGASACQAGVYDTATTPNTSIGNGVIEIGAAANTNVFVDLHNSPVVTASGTTTVITSTGSLVLYTLESNP